MDTNNHFIIKQFAQLSLDELYKLLQIRARVFVQEQQSIYDEVDDLDQDAYHVFKWDQDNLIAYARIIPPSLKNPSVKIGRVVVAKEARKQGIGRAIFQAAFAHAQSAFPNTPIKLSAQTTVKALYLSFGFRENSTPYDDGGVEHIDMIWLPA